MVAAVAAKLGMKCLLIQESWVPHEDAVYDRVGNILLSRLMGADNYGSTRASTSASAKAGRRRSTEVKARAETVRHPCRRLGP